MKHTCTSNRRLFAIEIITVSIFFLISTSGLFAQNSTPKPGNPRKHMKIDSKIGIVNHFNKDSKGDNEDFYFSAGSGNWRDKVQFRIHHNGTISTTAGIHADWGDLYLVADWDNSSSNEDIIFGFDGYQRNKVKERMRLTDDGRLGIGTKSPRSPLHVNGDIYSKGNIKMSSYEGEGKSGTAYIQARDFSGNSNIAFQFRTQKSGNKVDVLKMTSTGNVGIGTSSPQAKLDVRGNTTIIGNTKIDGDTNINGDTYIKGDLSLSNSDRSQAFLINKGLDLKLTNIPSSHFSVQNAFGTDALYIDTKGKIAIGDLQETELTEQLHVGGRIKAGGFIADASSFPDYVFANDYQLMSLAAVKAYTSQNHSLPGMPTEEEVLADGLDLKKVVTISVEKIEELYLHMFAQQQTIKKLEQQIKKLEKSK
ncbi:hypothetical protein [uncultured Aquimarina sp.]|uniref:hypothetical protein n=1 Tax=uncultured Aquimarina sp. TaxID=575652 RepID=UPI002608DDAE|nr:hypothetical protein [uncultured Aquimarina sp.]